MNTDLNRYWNSRSGAKMMYRGEQFYTITSLPLYYHRRAKVLKVIEQEINKLLDKQHVINIFDFGCGDGYYSRWIKKKWGASVNVLGYDTSKEMIATARNFSTSEKISINFLSTDLENIASHQFDIVLIIAVFAHLMDESVYENSVKQCCRLLKKSGRIILFEQTGAVLREGIFWRKRTRNQYLNSFSKYAFIPSEDKFISYPCFARIDKIVKYFLRFLARFQLFHEYENFNYSPIYCWLTTLIFYPSLLGDLFLTPSEGNSLFVLKKK